MDRFNTFLKYLTFPLVILFSGNLYSASKWDIGFNEPFVAQYLLSKNLYCITDYDPNAPTYDPYNDPYDRSHPNCPENMVSRDLNSIRSRILDLASNQHVGMYREIIPVAQLRPEPNINRYAEAADIINIYEDYNLKVVVSLGITIPLWMSSGTENMWHPMPTGDSDWDTLKNNLSWTMGDFVKYLWDDERISQDWIRTHLIIEGFNEFNALKTGPYASPANSYLSMTDSVTRLKSYEGGINYVLNHHNVQVYEHLMPSLSADGTTMSSYLSKYYVNHGGQSKPNVHIYFSQNAQTAAQKLAEAEDTINKIEQSMPSHLLGEIYLTETGSHDIWPPICSGGLNGLPVADREVLYRSMAESSIINSATAGIAFWRLMNLPQANCEALYGVVHQDNSGYKKVGTDLFDYLKN